MRNVHNPQASLGELNIADIRINPKSRDDIPAILLGLQYIYTTPDVRQKVFDVLAQLLPTSKSDSSRKASPKRGRSGMDQWKILVLGTLRLGLNTDYDRIHDLANHHNLIREMLGHGRDVFGEEAIATEYSLQTIKDNLMLFTPEILDEINQIVVQAGHTLVKKSPKDGETEEIESLGGRCDSFVVETHVHFPTDINLLYDAVRKAIEESADLAERYALTGWRQYKHNIKKLKIQYRKIQKIKHSTSKDEEKKRVRSELIKQQHQIYIDMATHWIERSEQTLEQINAVIGVMEHETLMLREYQAYTNTFIGQIHRRVILDEKIPHSEKIFSIFQPHTEWVRKGKAGVFVELGLRVSIMEDHHGFILHHKVMEGETDEKVTIEMVQESQKRFPALNSASFDKGYYTPDNLKELQQQLELAVLPKKGKRSKADQEREGSEEFGTLRKQHSAVESAINALEQHGLDTCPDHGINGFKRYVALAVVSRNIHQLGTIIRKQQLDKEKRKRGPYKKAA